MAVQRRSRKLKVRSAHFDIDLATDRALTTIRDTMENGNESENIRMAIKFFALSLRNGQAQKEGQS